MFTDYAGGWRELRQGTAQGYPMVQLSRARTGRTGSSVHRLVALAWVENPRPGVYGVVRHRDGDRSNAHASNLEWGTQLMNAGDALRHGTRARGPKHGASIRAGRAKAANMVASS